MRSAMVALVRVWAKLAALVAVLAVAVMCNRADAQTAATPSPAPATSQAPSAENPDDASSLTPAQREALQLLTIKTSQNPVGNITVLPFQNNFNYGVGPYARYQFNLNCQPVFPIMLSRSLTLISRTIVPLVSQPPSVSANVCEIKG